MAKAKLLSTTIKVKIKFDVDRALYDRIVALAKKENLQGTIENVLTQNCINWFKQWVGILARLDATNEATGGQGLVGPDGKPLTSSKPN